jgi:hypothetical protein
MLLIGVLRMAFLRSKLLPIVCALFAFFVIAGDLVADSIHNATRACVTESQTSGHDSCPACGCSIHTGSAVAPDAVAVLIPAAETTELMSATDDRPALGAPPAIDHPPQLG